MPLNLLLYIPHISIGYGLCNTYTKSCCSVGQEYQFQEIKYTGGEGVREAKVGLSALLYDCWRDLHKLIHNIVNEGKQGSGVVYVLWSKSDHRPLILLFPSNVP